MTVALGNPRALVCFYTGMNARAHRHSRCYHVKMRAAADRRQTCLPNYIGSNMTSLRCLGRAPFKLPRIFDRDQRAGRGCSQPIAGK